MRIWKYIIRTTDVIAVTMPRGAKILCVQIQREEPCIWALVDPNATIETRWLRIYGTGHPIDELGEYVGTYQLHNGSLIFHVFDVTKGALP